jgi:hypothetical protein
MDRDIVVPDDMITVEVGNQVLVLHKSVRVVRRAIYGGEIVIIASLRRKDRFFRVYQCVNGTSELVIDIKLSAWRVSVVDKWLDNIKEGKFDDNLLEHLKVVADLIAMDGFVDLDTRIKREFSGATNWELFDIVSGVYDLNFLTYLRDRLTKLKVLAHLCGIDLLSHWHLYSIWRDLSNDYVLRYNWLNSWLKDVKVEGIYLIGRLIRFNFVSLDGKVVYIVDIGTYWQIYGTVEDKSIWKVLKNVKDDYVCKQYASITRVLDGLKHSAVVLFSLDVPDVYRNIWWHILSSGREYIRGNLRNIFKEG